MLYSETENYKHFKLSPFTLHKFLHFHWDIFCPLAPLIGIIKCAENVPRYEKEIAQRKIAQLEMYIIFSFMPFTSNPLKDVY